MTPLRIIFMGTAELACASLAALCGTPAFQLVAVVTQPDRPRGRSLKLQPSPVKELALKSNLPVLQPERAREATFIAQLDALRPDLIVVAAYGQILPKDVLDMPTHGCINVHTSLLPKYRGAAPIQWAILNDEPVTGVTIMKMDAGLDTGDILAMESTPIDPRDNAVSLHDRLATMGARLLVGTIPDYLTGSIQPRKQPADDGSYARKITKEDGRLDWTLPARVIWNRVRGLVPWPGTFTHLKTADTPLLVKIWEAECVDTLEGKPGAILKADKEGIVVGCGRNALRILSLQLEGKRRMTAAEFLVGHKLDPSQMFAS